MREIEPKVQYSAKQTPEEIEAAIKKVLVQLPPDLRAQAQEKLEAVKGPIGNVSVGFAEPPDEGPTLRDLENPRITSFKAYQAKQAKAFSKAKAFSRAKARRASKVNARKTAKAKAAKAARKANRK